MSAAYCCRFQLFMAAPDCSWLSLAALLSCFPWLHFLAPCITTAPALQAPPILLRSAALSSLLFVAALTSCIF
ncbi:hypothetical protein V8C86DRAFT_2463837 [Haematococcus lacustris]